MILSHRVFVILFRFNRLMNKIKGITNMLFSVALILLISG